jgi:hypothetical protein
VWNVITDSHDWKNPDFQSLMQIGYTILKNFITSDFNSIISVRCIRIIMRIVPDVGVYCVNHDRVQQTLGCLKFTCRTLNSLLHTSPRVFCCRNEKWLWVLCTKFTGDPNQDRSSTMRGYSWTFQSSVWHNCPSCLMGITASHVLLYCSFLVGPFFFFFSSFPFTLSGINILHISMKFQMESVNFAITFATQTGLEVSQ